CPLDRALARRARIALARPGNTAAPALARASADEGAIQWRSPGAGARAHATLSARARGYALGLTHQALAVLVGRAVAGRVVARDAGVCHERLHVALAPVPFGVARLHALGAGAEVVAL